MNYIAAKEQVRNLKINKLIHENEMKQTNK